MDLSPVTFFPWQHDKIKTINHSSIRPAKILNFINIVKIYLHYFVHTSCSRIIIKVIKGRDEKYQNKKKKKKQRTTTKQNVWYIGTKIEKYNIIVER